MESQELIKRFKINYELLTAYYKQGWFEETVPVTKELKDYKKFYLISRKNLPGERRELVFDLHSAGKRGKGRNPHDLEWATTELRECAVFLYRNYKNEQTLPRVDRRDIVLYYYRTLSLSYEVEDYFLDVTDEASDFLIKLTTSITDDFHNYLEKYSELLINTDTRQELIKQILVVALCGINEFYRRHEYKEGLARASKVNMLIGDLPEGQGRWFGLKGLHSYVTGKIHTAMGRFGEAEEGFRHSVEAYSESVWRKEREFAKYTEDLKHRDTKHGGKSTENGEIRRKSDYKKRQRAHELSRAVALRRSGLASSFGYAFQSLVMGKVKDAIRLSALARAVVNRNTGKIYSSYVDLIYYSAKRAENSSNRDALIEIKTNLRRCYRVFKDLIPNAHYKNRALFQISLVHHYLARWHKEKGLGTPAIDERHRELKRAEKHWLQAGRCLETTINDDKLKHNKRLLAESMAIRGHVLSNLALLSIHFGRNDEALMNEAEISLVEAWGVAEQHPHIQCEVGLAQAAVGKARADFCARYTGGHESSSRADLTNALPVNAPERAIFRTSLSKARQILFKVLELNNDESRRVQATAYLRLTEIALMQRETSLYAREYFQKYEEISSQVEHDFCERWASELRGRISQENRFFTFTIEPAGENSQKTDLEARLEAFYVEQSIAAAVDDLEKSMSGVKKMRKNLEAYLSAAFFENFGIVAATSNRWIKKHRLVEKLKSVSSAAADFERLSRERKLKNAKRRKQAPTPEKSSAETFT